MPTEVWNRLVEPGEIIDTGLEYQRGDILCIRNNDFNEFDVLPWGYLDYMSLDRPSSGDRILFRELRLVLRSTAFKDDTDWIPRGYLWLYVLESYPFTQADLSIWSPF